MADTKIEWTSKTWNATRGCSLVSAGCKHCYAMKQAHRFSGPGQPYEGLTKLGANGPIWTGKVREAPEMLEAPLHWRKPARIFVDSMSDLFHEDVSFDYVDQVMAIMAYCRRHTFQVLTKRPKRMARYFAERSLGDVYTNILRLADTEGAFSPSPLDPVRGVIEVLDDWQLRDGTDPARHLPQRWPLPNVHLGVSVESQATADERIPHLLQTPAAIRWVSYEPALERVDFTRVRHSLRGASFEVASVLEGDDGFGLNKPRNRLDWAVCGGESGPGAREFRVEWAHDFLHQFHTAGVPAFLKQLGSHVTASYYDDEWRNHYEFQGWDWPWPKESRKGWQPELSARVRLRFKDRKGGDPAEWWEGLRVRQMPGEVAHA